MSLFTTKVIKYSPRLQKDLTLKKFQADGIWGNIGTETGGFKALQEIKPTVAGSRGGYGWKQWTGPRRRAYEAWCKQNNLNPADDESNYRYLVWEGLNSESYAISKLRQTKTLEEATEVYMKLDLRPGIPHLENRIKWAREAFNATPSTTTTVIKSPIGKTIGGVVAGTGAGAAVAPTSYLPYILWGGIGILSTIVIVYVIYKYIQYKKTINTNVIKRDLPTVGITN